MDEHKTVYEPVCYKNRPAVIVGKSRPEQPTFVATVIYFIEEDNMLKPCIETVFDRTQITDYYCPYAGEAMFPMVHCTDDGKCIYPVTPAKLSSMCLACKADSMTEFLHNEGV